jgi:predicted secreted protein
MGWIPGIFVYVLIWWVVIFAVLPWGVKVPDEPEPGHASSAPRNPHLLIKVIVTTVVSFVIWLIVRWIITSGIISFWPK